MEAGGKWGLVATCTWAYSLHEAPLVREHAYEFHTRRLPESLRSKSLRCSTPCPPPVDPYSGILVYPVNRNMRTKGHTSNPTKTGKQESRKAELWPNEAPCSFCRRSMGNSLTDTE